MVTKGIIKSIDLLGNTCTVHIPFFETAGNDPIVETATISNTPGMYNGYRVGDAVYVAFEDGRMDTPVVIGKLYLGTEKEKADPRGVSNVEESTAAKKATLPADSKLTAEIDSHVPNTTVPYSSLSSIANGLNTLNTEVGQMDRDFGNRFKQVFSNTEGMQSTIEQNSNSIKNSVLHKIGEGGEIQDLGDGLTTKGLGWQLDENQWVIKAYDQNKENTLPAEGLDLFKIDRTTVEISAPIIRLGGYPRTTVIRYAYSSSETEHPALYKADITGPTLVLENINLDETGQTGWTSTVLARVEGKYIWQWTQTAKYEYDENSKKLNDIVEDTIICLTGFQGEKGQDGAQGISIASQTTYYALIHPEYTTGTVDAPSKDNLAVSVESEKTKEEQWSTTPPTHTDTTREEGWKYWTTIKTTKSDGTSPFSKPVINEDLNGVYAIAQGKTTNYYSDTDPRNAGHSVKKGDCWFQTISPDDEENYNKELKETDQGKLYQWNGSAWEDIGGELVANKLTANYINALDITAKKIEILDNSTPPKTIFKADGTKTENKEVQIGGFTVTADSIASASESVYIGPDGIRIGDGFAVSVPAGSEKTEITLSEDVSQQISAVTYWLSSSCVVHTGTKHSENITVTAMKKIGSGNEGLDTEAYLWWKYSTESTWTLANNLEDSHNILTLTSVEDANIRIIATHEESFSPNTEGIDIDTDENIYEREEITFSPLNTPVLDLTNDSAAIAYNGDSKITETDLVETTATLYLNGSEVTENIDYNWTLINCSNENGSTTVSGKLLKIKDLEANTATATCTASCTSGIAAGTYTKVFTITKQLKGADGTSGISPVTLEIENDYDSIPCTADGTIDDNYKYNTNTQHTLRVFEGTTQVPFKVVSTNELTATLDSNNDTTYVVCYEIENSNLTATLTSRTTVTPEDPTHKTYSACIDELKEDKGKIKYTVYKGKTQTVLATGCFTAEKRYCGENAVDYYLLPSTTQVFYDTSAKTYDPTNGTVNITLWKQEGRSNPETIPTAEINKFIIKVNGATRLLTTATVSLNIISRTTIELYLKSNPANQTSSPDDILLDTETISIVKDGSASIKLEIINDFVSFPCDYTGNIAESVRTSMTTQTEHTLKLFKGTDPASFRVKPKTDYNEDNPLSGNVIYYTVSDETITFDKTDRSTARSTPWTASVSNWTGTAEKAEITYEVYNGPNLLTTSSFRLEKRKSGEPTKIYYIQSSDSTVKYNTSTKKYSPSTINFSFFSQEGTQNPVSLNNSNFYYRYTCNYTSSSPTSGTGQVYNARLNNFTWTWTPSSSKIVESYTVSLYSGNPTDPSAILLDTETIPVVQDGAKGDPGANGINGKGVASTTKFYRLSTVGFLSDEDLPEGKTPKHYQITVYNGESNENWTPSPVSLPTDAKTKQYYYYETTRTVYDNDSYEWSTPVKSSMLTVDFIQSLGITAKKIEVQDSNSQTIFKADGLNKETNGEVKPIITLGGWQIEEDGSGTFNESNKTVNGINAGWVFRGNNGTIENLYCSYDIRFEYVTPSSGSATDVKDIPLSPPPILGSSTQYFKECYVFYYMSSRGLRFRICKSDSFNNVLVTTNNLYSGSGGSSTVKYFGIYDFNLMKISSFRSDVEETSY